jgi:hypothetical protein
VIIAVLISFKEGGWGIAWGWIRVSSVSLKEGIMIELDIRVPVITIARP